MSIWTQPGGSSALRRRVSLWALCGALPVLSVGYQITAKRTAQALSHIPFGWDWLGHLVQLHWAQAMLALEIASFAAWMTALSEMKLSAAFPMSAVSYVLIIAAGWTLFQESVSAAQIAGGAVILAGIWMIGRSESEALPV